MEVYRNIIKSDDTNTQDSHSHKGAHYREVTILETKWNHTQCLPASPKYVCMCVYSAWGSGVKLHWGFLSQVRKSSRETHCKNLSLRWNPFTFNKNLSKHKQGRIKKENNTWFAGFTAGLIIFIAVYYNYVICLSFECNIKLPSTKDGHQCDLK